MYPLKIISINQSTYLLWPLLKLVMVFIKAFLFCILAITIKAGPSKRNFALCLIGDSRLQAKFGGLVAYIVAACKVVHEVFQHDNTSLAAWDLEILRTRLHILPLVESVSKKKCRLRPQLQKERGFVLKVLLIWLRLKYKTKKPLWRP